MSTSYKDTFNTEGYLIVDVLTEKEVADFRVLMDALISPEIRSGDTKKRSSSFQHLGDEIADFGREARQYYFHLLTKPGTQPILHAFHHPVILKTVEAQIAPFNKKNVPIGETTSFQRDLEWDSLTVMDFVAAIEDEFDIIITMNMQAEIETVGQLADAVAKLKA